jgi:hypothetical protein
MERAIGRQPGYYSLQRNGSFYRLTPDDFAKVKDITGIAKAREGADIHRCWETGTFTAAEREAALQQSERFATKGALEAAKDRGAVAGDSPEEDAGFHAGWEARASYTPSGEYVAVDLTANNAHMYEEGNAPDFGWGVCRQGHGLQAFGDGYMPKHLAEARAAVLNAGLPATYVANV